MARFGHCTLYDALENEYEFPVVMLGDLSNYPDGSQNTHGVFCGMCSGYSAAYRFKSVEGGVAPAHLAAENTIRYTMGSYNVTDINFYPDPDYISINRRFGVHHIFQDHDWYTYTAQSSSEQVDCNDRAGWDVSVNNVRVAFGLATIDGVERLGLYYYGFNLGPGGGDTWNGWTFAYETAANSAWVTLLQYMDIDTNTPNPYKPGGYSEEGGGQRGKQNFGDYSDMVNPDAMPDETEYSAVACGLITIFSPTKAQIQNLADMLWNKTFFDFLEHEFSGIEDLFISFGLVPFTITTGGSVAVSFMNFWEYISPGPVQPVTKVTLTKAANQFMEFNMGNVSLTGGDSSNAYASDSVLDYSPYSKLGIYLPFIGYQEMDIDECREKTINLKYRIDILSGACVALISINGRTMYQFSGNCLTQLPLTSSDYSSMISNAVNVGIAASSAGTAAAVASAGDALTASKAGTRGFTQEMGDYQNAQHAAQVSNAENSLAGATANGFMGMKPNFKKTGAISGSTGLLSVKQPYLCLTTPRQSMPEGYDKVCGFPCNIGGKLGDFTGYTVVEDIRLNGLVATSPEVDEIYQLLKTGVII